MSESSNHRKLVELIIEYVGKKVGHDFICFIETDLSDDHPLPQMTDSPLRFWIFIDNKIIFRNTCIHNVQILLKT